MRYGIWHPAEALHPRDTAMRSGQEVVAETERLLDAEEYDAAAELLVQNFAKWPIVVISCCSEVIQESDNLALRITFAALALMWEAMGTYYEFPSGVLAAAESVLTESLSSADEGCRFVAALNLSGMAQPTIPMLRPLCEMLANDTPHLRVIAAAALSNVRDRGNVEEHSGDMEVSTLVRTLQAGVLSLTHGASGEADTYAIPAAAYAARGLARLGRDTSDACEAMVSALEESSLPEEQAWIITALKDVGRGSAAARSALVRHLNDEESTPLTRRQAATVLTVIIDVSEIGILVELLAHEDRGVVDGMFAGLAVRKTLCEALAETFARSYLRHHDTEMRSVTARLFSELATIEPGVGRLLLDRLGEEMDMWVLAEIGEAVSKGGKDILPTLIDKIRSGNVSAFEGSVIAIRHIGVAGVRALVDAIQVDGNLYTRSALCLALRDFGDELEAVVPDLGKALLAAENDDEVMLLVQAIAATGKAAIDALPALIQVLGSTSSGVVGWVEVAIRGIGEGARHQLRAALPSASEVVRERLEGCLALLPRMSKRFKRMSRVEDEKFLQFLHASECINKHYQTERTPLPLWKIAGILNVQRKNKLIVLRETVSKSSVSRAFKEVSKEIADGKPLRVKKGRGDGPLTVVGQRVRLEVREYLCQKGLVGRLPAD